MINPSNESKTDPLFPPLQSMCKHLMGHKGNAPQPQSYGSNGDSHFNNQFAPPASHFNNQSGPRGGGGFQQGGPVNNQREGRPPPPGAVSSSLEPGSDKHIQMLPPMLRDAVVVRYLVTHSSM